MGKLKPIGSEKLQGMDKINRMIEIARYKENIPNPINEDASVEYKKVLPDGHTYRIDKEKNGYVIVKGLNESEMDYIEPMKNRKYYSSYSQAFKRLNLITKEVNSLMGNEKNVSLFNEGDDKKDKTKYFLKMEQAPPTAAPAPAPAPAPVPAEVPAEEPSPEMPEEPMEPEMDAETEMGDEQDDEIVTFKTIQKLTGKLAQKIRTLAADEENPMSSKDIKYVINSVLSAFDLNLLDEEDRDEIMGKFEGEEMAGDEMGMEDMGDMGDEEVPADEMGDEEVPAEMMEMFDEYESEAPEEPRMAKIKGLDDKHSFGVEDMIEGLFSESKVDQILKKYFNVSETEKVITEQKKDRKKEMIWKINQLSENVEQEVISRKLINKFSDAKLLGRTKKKDLVFEINESKVRVTPKGEIL